MLLCRRLLQRHRELGRRNSRRRWKTVRAAYVLVYRVACVGRVARRLILHRAAWPKPANRPDGAGTKCARSEERRVGKECKCRWTRTACSKRGHSGAHQIAAIEHRNDETSID